MQMLSDVGNTKLQCIPSDLQLPPLPHNHHPKKKKSIKYWRAKQCYKMKHLLTLLRDRQTQIRLVAPILSHTRKLIRLYTTAI